MPTKRLNMSIETRRKLSDALKGRIGHPQTSETKEKIRQALRGRTIPLAQREKQGETRKRLFAEGKLRIPWAGSKGLIKGHRGPAAGRSWKGGRWQDKHGYIWVKVWEYPNATKDGYLAEHRLVMTQILGRPLAPFEAVHHRNGCRADNRPANLLLVLTGGHKGAIKCPFCRKEFAVK